MNFVMETNGGKKTFSNYYPQYKNPLCSKMEDSQPQSGIQKFCNAAYSNKMYTCLGPFPSSHPST